MKFKLGNGYFYLMQRWMLLMEMDVDDCIYITKKNRPQILKSTSMKPV